MEGEKIMTGRKLGIIGVTGFIGGKLAARARRDGWSICGFSRAKQGPHPDIQEWRIWSAQPDLSGLDAIVNLSGHPIDRRWTESNRRLFYESRVGTTRTLVAALSRLPESDRPGVLINGSGAGIYGDRQEEILDEDAPTGESYLADLCREWEAAAGEAAPLGIRVARLRTGIVLGTDGPAFRKMLLLFKLGLGGRLGSGQQRMPWIHIDDVVGAILHVAAHPRLAGAINVCAPEPEKNRDFTRMLAESVHRPAFFHVPGAALRLALGGFGGALLEGQRAIPRALLESGFKFEFPGLREALKDLMRKN